MARWYEQLWPMGGVLSASLLIAWATEVLSFFLSRGLAFAILALLQVLPEFAVEAVITSEAALDHSRLEYVTANFTGANRLIVGLFIPLVFFMAARTARKRGQRLRELEIPNHSSVEIVALIIPTLYSFTIVMRGSLGLVDAVLLTGMYATYLYIVFKLPPGAEEDHDELPLVPRTIRTYSVPRQKLIIFLFFLVGGALLFLSVHPFYENTIELGVALGIAPYFLFQWLAPFLSEFPEFITIVYWGRTGRAQLGLTNAISSKVNQWTLLIAMIPVVFVGVSLYNDENVYSIRFSEGQQLEILLTAAQGLFAAMCFLNLRFHRWEATTLFGLWAFQLFDPLLDGALRDWSGGRLPYFFEPSPTLDDPNPAPHYIREWVTVAYLLLSIVPLLNKRRFAAFHAFADVMRTHLGKRPAEADAAKPKTAA